MNDNIKATLVYDQSHFAIPVDLLPKGVSSGDALAIIATKNQMLGTNPECVTELAGRSCYDSLGTGRNSPDYHKHIQEVGHLSVCEHFNFTVAFQATHDDEIATLLGVFSNRPGLWIVPRFDRHEIQVTLNLRSVLEWDRINNDFKLWETDAVGIRLKRIAHELAPMIVPLPRDQRGCDGRRLLDHELTSEQQMWVSLFMAGSRGWSHEQVRHGDRTAISQRSTRYVDETDSGWIEHPVITAYKDDLGAAYKDKPLFVLSIPDSSKATCLSEYIGQDIYAPTVDKLQAWLIGKGVDKFTARKQARGAARGYLGNALTTEMIFSASVAQWKLIMGQRLNAAADAEIREVSFKALAELRKSQWGDHFAALSTKPSPDGIGYVLA